MAEIPAVRSVMTSAPLTVEVDAPLREAQDLMIDHEIRHLPVVEAGRLVGIVSDRDVAAVDNDSASRELMERLKSPSTSSSTSWPSAASARRS